MRVFETLGAGSLLVGVPAPGVETLVTPGKDFIPMSNDPGAQIATLLEETDAASSVAASGHAAVMARHSYDHRVDLLLDILASTDHAARATPTRTGLAAAIAKDVEVHRIVAFGTDTLGDELPLHEVWDGASLGDRLGVKSFDAVAIGGSGDSLQAALQAAVHSAYRFVYALTDTPGVEQAVRELRPGATVRAMGDVVRFDVEGR